MTTPPQLSLVPSNDMMPSDEIIKQLDIDNNDFGDFAVCVRILTLQMQGVKYGDACAQAGINKRTVYEQRWQDLMAKARRLMAGPLLMQAQATANYVYDQWPAIINSMVNVALNGQRDHEKVAAAEFLRDTYPMLTQSEAKDEKPELDYLKKPKNFNPLVPLMPIQVNEGGTVIIHTGEKDES